MSMRVLVAAWVGSTNLGDELVFAALRRKLAARDAEAVAISVDPSATERVHGVAAVGHTDLAGLWREAGRADALVFGGGGLLQDESSALNLPFHLSRLWLARLRHRPIGLVSLGVGPLATPLGRALVRHTLPPWAEASVRDLDSARLLVRVCGIEPIVAADLALSLPEPDVGVDDVLGVCLRPLPAPGVRPASARWRAGGPDAALLDALAAGLDAAAAQSGCSLRFIAFQRDRDDALHRLVAARTHAPATFVAPGVDEVVDEVAACRAVVSMRYHGGIAALLGARPAVLLRTSGKLAALDEQGSEGTAVLPISAEGARAIPAALGRVSEQADALPAAREALRALEQGNDLVIDRLLAREPLA